MSYDFKNQWFSHPEWWFANDESIDELLVHKYGHLMDEVAFDDAILAILTWDQLARHYYRKEHANHIILYFLQKAIALTKGNLCQDYLDSLSPCEFTFYLMPLRHGGSVKDILRVLELSWNKLLKCDETKDECGVLHLKRFLTATYDRMNVEKQRDLLIKQNYIKGKSIINNNTNIGNFEKCKNENGRFILSLSGGVDSMVCSWMLKKLFGDKRTIAVMINYGNRETCDSEVSFVKEWCEKIGITLYVRNLHEINRPTCMKFAMREIYESYTRNVRYECYKNVWDMEFGKGVLTVIMGHNKNDSFENIMTNMTMKNHWDNLHGMSDICSVDGIRFLRPLLGVWKNEIRAYATEHHIPHLPCSTPKWSQRGRIRSEVVPALDGWNKDCVGGLFEMADMMKDLYEVMLEKVDGICDCLSLSFDGKMYMVRFNTCLQSKIVNRKMNKVFVWHHVFGKLLDGKIVISQKSLKNFVEIIDKWLDRDGKNQKVMLSKNVCFVL